MEFLAPRVEALGLGQCAKITPSIAVVDENNFSLEICGQRRQFLNAAVNAPCEQLTIMKDDFGGVLGIEFKEKFRVELRVAGEEYSLINEDAATPNRIPPMSCTVWQVPSSKEL